MKTLNIVGNPALLQLADQALFREIEDAFKLHPGKLADDMRRLARRDGKDVFVLLNQLRDLIPLEFDLVLAMVGEGRGGDGSRMYWREIRNKFNLDPNHLHHKLFSHTQAHGMDLKTTTDAIRAVVPIVIKWSLDVVEGILTEEAVE